MGEGKEMRRIKRRKVEGDRRGQEKNKVEEWKADKKGKGRITIKEIEARERDG